MNFIDGSLSEQGAFSTAAMTLDLSNYEYATKPKTSTDVVLGIRAEQIQLTPDGALAGAVTLIEPMGNHQVVWIKIGTHTLSVIVNDTREFVIDETVNFSIDTARVSMFNPLSEQRI